MRNIVTQHPPMSGYVFAAYWEDGSAEVTITHNGTAEYRYSLARSLGGPKRILHGDVPKRGRQPMTPNQVLAYMANKLNVPVESFTEVPVVGGVSYHREAR